MVYFLCKVYDSDRQNCYFAQSLPVRGAWIEMAEWEQNGAYRESLPVRGAWIEIVRRDMQSEPDDVAPRAGSVD